MKLDQLELRSLQLSGIKGCTYVTHPLPYSEARIRALDVFDGSAVFALVFACVAHGAIHSGVWTHSDLS